MARILPVDVVPAFLAAYKVPPVGCDCSADGLTVKVWDLYGTAPKQGDEITAEGSYIAAVVICESCGRNVELHRQALSRDG